MLTYAGVCRYGKEKAEFKLALLTASAPRSARADGVSIVDVHALDASVKADQKGSPFWLWLSWPLRCSVYLLHWYKVQIRTPEKLRADTGERRRHGLHLLAYWYKSTYTDI
jgi:hypothetical protein